MKTMTVPEVILAVSTDCGAFFGEARCMRIKPDGEILYIDETDVGTIKLSQVSGVDIRAAYVLEDGRAGLAIFGRITVDLLPLVREIAKNAGKYGKFKIWRCSARRTTEVTLVTTNETSALLTKNYSDVDLAFDNNGNPQLEAFDKEGNLVTLF